MKALNTVYAKFSDKGHLLVGFHSFDQDFMTTIPDQCDDVLQHRPACGRAAIVKKRTVDLHRVEVDQSKP